MPNLGPNFYPKLVNIASELGMKPEDLLAVMISESGLNPSAVEDKYKGSGLIGFMPDTLKGLNFKGDWQDFIKLSGEQQLDFVKSFVESRIKNNNGGRPFKSAAQYYTANFIPIAMSLPGIQKEDPNQPFLENHPETVTDPTSGTHYSKKYYEVGQKLSADRESKYYKANPLFDKDKKGSITYGDMMKRVDDIKSGAAYKKALADMQNATGYTPSTKEEPPTHKEDSSGLVANRGSFEDVFQSYIKSNPHDNVWEQLGASNSTPTNSPSANSSSQDGNLDQMLDNYLQQANMRAAASDKSLYIKHLPQNNILIKINANDFASAVEFGHILCTALDEELKSNAFVHTDGDKVEVSCSINGPEISCYQAVKQLSSELSKVFKKATKKIGGVKISTYCFLDSTSRLQPISLKTASIQHRKFLLKFT